MSVPREPDDPHFERVATDPESGRGTADESRRAKHDGKRRTGTGVSRIGRERTTAGGPGGSVRDEIRRRLASGTLLRTTGPAGFGAPRGDRRCACCDEPIVAPAAECVIRDRVELHAHGACFSLWAEESSRQVATGWRAPSGAPARRPRSTDSSWDSPSSTPRRWRAR